MMKRRNFIRTSAMSSAFLASKGIQAFQTENLQPELPTIKKPLNLYGSLESVIEGIRANNALDLNSVNWRKKNPGGTFKQWQSLARKCVLNGLNYDPGILNLNPERMEVKDRGEFTLEKVRFNTTPWHRLEGYFLLPKGVKYPVPGIVALHAWGGPMCFGKDRIVNSGRDHEVLASHRKDAYDGVYLAEEIARRGYAVIVIDAHHFGPRIPKGINDIPIDVDPFSLSADEYKKLDEKVRSLLYYGLTQLNWAGTTWAGLNYYDDSRCIDYLLSRPEVNPEKIGVTGLSGGGWRTDMLAALDPRIKASVSVGWMTTGDMLQLYNIRGAVGTFCLLPGVWNRLDIPDLAAMSAPNACMVVVGNQDLLFPTEGKEKYRADIKAVFDWAGCSNKVSFYTPDTVHCYNRDIQEKAFTWFDNHLK
jgi:dienelactone hydrolase